jgi:prevent-host-death family protein
MTITLEKARDDFEGLFDRVNRTQKRVKIRAKNRCAYLISQEELDGLQATLELSAIPGMVESILEGGKESFEDCVSPEELGWNMPKG